jgi:prepilin-type processing-associated H-X9-DG protein
LHPIRGSDKKQPPTLKEAPMKISSPSSRRTPPAFTLVELLIVIGIIALLIAILMPTLGRARESANSLKCQAQQRQILQAMMLHANEHKGYMPLTGLPWIAPNVNGFDPPSLGDPSGEKYDYYGDNPNNRHVMSLQGALAPQLGQQINTESKATVEAGIRQGIVRALFNCPSDREDQRLGATVWDGGDGYSSYVFNDAALSMANSSYADGSGLRSYPNVHSRLRGKVSRFVHPSELCLMMDGSPRSYGGWQVFCDVDSDVTLRDLLVTTSGPANNPHANPNSTFGYVCDWDIINFKRHHGRANIGFADGHVENVLLTEAALAQISINKGFPAE